MCRNFFLVQLQCPHSRTMMIPLRLRGWPALVQSPPHRHPPRRVYTLHSFLSVLLSNSIRVPQTRSLTQGFIYSLYNLLHRDHLQDRQPTQQSQLKSLSSFHVPFFPFLSDHSYIFQDQLHVFNISYHTCMLAWSSPKPTFFFISHKPLSPTCRIAKSVKVLRGLLLTKLSDYMGRDSTRQEVGVPTAIAVQVYIYMYI